MSVWTWLSVCSEDGVCASVLHTCTWQSLHPFMTLKAGSCLTANSHLCQKLCNLAHTVGWLCLWLSTMNFWVAFRLLKRHNRLQRLCLTWRTSCSDTCCVCEHTEAEACGAFIHLAEAGNGENKKRGEMHALVLCKTCDIRSASLALFFIVLLLSLCVCVWSSIFPGTSPVKFSSSSVLKDLFLDRFLHQIQVICTWLHYGVKLQWDDVSSRCHIVQLLLWWPCVHCDTSDYRSLKY